MRSREFLPLKARFTGYLWSVIIGISFGAAWTPCIGPILGSILALAAGAKGMSQGITLLAAYSVGFAIPFLLAAWASGSVLIVLQKYEKLLKGIHIAGGILLVFIGILIMILDFSSSVCIIFPHNIPIRAPKIINAKPHGSIETEKVPDIPNAKESGRVCLP